MARRRVGTLRQRRVSKGYVRTRRGRKRLANQKEIKYYKGTGCNRKKYTQAAVKRGKTAGGRYATQKMVRRSAKRGRPRKCKTKAKRRYTRR